MRQRGTIRTALTVFAASALLILPQMAQAAPSEEEIAAAKAAEEAASMSVAEIEVKLAEVNATAATATQNAQIAGEDLNEAQIALNAATATANKASADADAAEAAFQEGKQQIASVAQATYRNGGGSLDAIAPYLEADGLRGVETKQVGINSFSSSAEAKMQNVAALEQVAKVTRDAANTALDNQKKATDEVQARTDAANKAATDAQTQANIVAAQRDAYVKELATKQNTTVDLINQREADLEAQRQAAAAEAARQAAAAEAARQAAAAEAARQAQSQRQQSSYVAPAPAAPSYSEPSYSGGGGGGNSDAAAGAIAWAKSKLGAPYVWAGEGPGYDCSGLVTMAYRSQGIYLTHWSQAQYSEGTRVPVSQAQPGDLIFWNWDGGNIDHVAIYLGNNQIIEAPTFGVPVRITSIYGWSAVLPYAVRVA